MKKILYLVLLSIQLLLISCYEQECDCKKYKEGTFEFTQKINGKNETSTFTRTANKQIETYQGKTDSAHVRWVNDCEFILQKIKPKSREDKKAIAIKILTTNNKGYTFEYSFVGESKKNIGFVTKVK
ncbi:hypothetical protein Q361_102211 [Flavobacterium croceum DSM 17960]|uniref:DNA topoisomerase IV n=1 Tax=Flavobacterium croceum DSM 17960 TaxID=1121886 RepID=A0A2S4NB25_9FLAO|nr:DNA topoisomerase IV [Flavobacterium croceum]POS02897.1 hypothetical protein Q361_102211 [Flavobacterium croceum DSM 17960]